MNDAAETPVAWTAIPAHAPVIASDGKEVGRVVEVAALPEEDIFHGVVFHHHALGTALLVPASQVARITDHAVYLSIDATGAEHCEPFHEEHINRLGLHGVYRWKHFGWKQSSE